VTSTVCLQYTDSKVQTHMLTSLRRILDITQTLADPSDFDRLRLENDERQKQRDAEARNQSLERAWRAALLEWLVFAEIEDRRRRIPEAHKNTLRWVLEDDDDETGFASWAKDGNGIFWVKGKPASGKSTLMKYIADHERLEQLLRAWTGTTPLAIASFWFWAAGSTSACSGRCSIRYSKRKNRRVVLLFRTGKPSLLRRSLLRRRYRPQ
jgi:hypothetical protein